MKRIVSFTILLVMVLTILPVNVFAASPTGEKFWIEDNILYWEQEDGVKYDLIFYGTGGAIMNGGEFEEIDDDHFDLLRAPKYFSYGYVFISGQNRSSKVAMINAEDNDTFIVISYDLLATIFLVDETATTRTYGWPDLGATRYKVGYEEGYRSAYKVLYVDGETSITIPCASSSDPVIEVTALDGLYMAQKFATRDFSFMSKLVSFKLSPTNTDRLMISKTTNEYIISWDAIDFVSQYRFSYKKATDSEYTILKPQKNASVTLPFTEDETFLVYLEAKLDDEWQWIGSRTINGTSELGDTPETYANGSSDTDASDDNITGLRAEAAGNGVVKLSWDAVKDAENYKVYYRKAGASKWSGGTGSFVRTKTNLSIRFKGDSEYELKIVAGDKESDILTVKPSAKKGTVWTKAK